MISNGLTRRIMIGEGTAEPTVAIGIALEMFYPAPVEFLFGVRRTSEGLQELSRPGVTVRTLFPGRGLSRAGLELHPLELSAYGFNLQISNGLMPLDAVVVVAGPPGADGSRSLGTVNGYMQTAINRASHVLVEEDPLLCDIPGAARIPADKVRHVVTHVRAAYQALSRPSDPRDSACAEQVAGLISDGVTLQLGVGGTVDAVGDALLGKKAIRIVTGAIGTSVRSLYEHGCLDPAAPIIGTALVGDDGFVSWAASTNAVRLAESSMVHNPAWLADMKRFHSINAAISIDLNGNVNGEWVSGRRVSGRGGAPDFSSGASRSPDGGAIIMLRSDRSGCLVDEINDPTIPGESVSWVVCERGAADLRGKTLMERASLLEKLLS